MNSFENYLNEDLLGEDLLENYGEDFSEALRRPTTRFGRNIRPTVSPGVTRPSNFGNNLSGHSADYATKSDLKKALDTISTDVNDLKKSTLATTKSIEALDAKHTEYAKLNARSGDNHKTVLKNMQMMSMMGSLLNQPKFIPANLIVKDGKVAGEYTVEEAQGKPALQIDQTMSLMLPMLTTMGDSGSGKSDNSNMMLPLVLLMTQDKDKSSSDKMLPIVMMMMMNNK